MSAERGGLKRVYIIIPLSHPKTQSLSSFKTKFLSSRKLRSVSTKTKKDQTCPPAKKKKRILSALFCIHLQNTCHCFFLFFLLLFLFQDSVENLTRPCSQSSRPQPGRGYRRHPRPSHQPSACSGSSRPACGGRPGSRGQAGSGCREQAR